MRKNREESVLGSRKAALDLGALALLFFLVTYFAAKYEAFDAFVSLARKHRELSLEDMATGIFVLSGLLLLFSLRRWLELRMAVASSRQEEETLRLTKRELERAVANRTVELVVAGELLEKEIKDRKRAQEQLEYRAFYDSLTDLPNRALFLNRLKDLFEYKRRYSDFNFAVLFMDVDRFKVINDSLGHLIGDQLLVMVGQRLKRCVRASDTAARFGGDEFAILARGLKKPDDVHIVAGRIIEVMKQPFGIFGQEVFASLSIGVAHCDLSYYDLSYYDRPAEILRDADIAMYKAKAMGGACHAVFDSTMHAAAVTAFQVETDLRNAIDRKEFRVYYQPVVRASDGSIAGFEALLRWEHPERGLLLPGDFLHVAEETGLIVPIGKWVLREACGRMRSWRDEFPRSGDMTMSVNLSNREFMQQGFVEIVRTVLDETGLDPRGLRLEITERVMVHDPEYASSLVRRLKEMGVKIDVDDFGTGHSTLSSLRDFHVDALKIDRTFIGSLGADGQNAAIVRTIVSLAKALGLEVVAEGVETEEQLSLIKEMDCGYIQGFYCHRPMDALSAEALLGGEHI